MRVAESHHMRVRRAAAQVASFAGDAPLALVKQRSNLYRHRGAGARHRVDLGALCHVLGLRPRPVGAEVAP